MKLFYVVLVIYSIRSYEINEIILCGASHTFIL